MAEAEDGTVRAVIIKQGSIDHVINVINKNGNVYFVDAQMEKIVNLNPNLNLDIGRP